MRASAWLARLGSIAKTQGFQTTFVVVSAKTPAIVVRLSSWTLLITGLEASCQFSIKEIKGILLQFRRSVVECVRCSFGCTV